MGFTAALGRLFLMETQVEPNSQFNWSPTEGDERSFSVSGFTASQWPFRLTICIDERDDFMVRATSACYSQLCANLASTPAIMKSKCKWAQLGWQQRGASQDEPRTLLQSFTVIIRFLFNLKGKKRRQNLTRVNFLSLNARILGFIFF